MTDKTELEASHTTGRLGIWLSFAAVTLIILAFSFSCQMDRNRDLELARHGYEWRDNASGIGGHMEKSK